eukprot:TRINITY_DN33188_c0_g1_i1.p3 TRINITY_DN33188_c0_g1~~TRINITY_DN33188_c0_g1_i1.p3  ORF type:complete len:120 (+),score=4.57 TRINITY_DN33188_c0_g1_i1:667-1026(+)
MVSRQIELPEHAGIRQRCRKAPGKHVVAEAEGSQRGEPSKGRRKGAAELIVIKVQVFGFREIRNGVRNCAGERIQGEVEVADVRQLRHKSRQGTGEHIVSEVQVLYLLETRQRRWRGPP